jgi:Beta-lactamase enzyme family
MNLPPSLSTTTFLIVLSLTFILHTTTVSVTGSASSASSSRTATASLSEQLRLWLSDGAFNLTFDRASNRSIHHLNNVDISVAIFPSAAAAGSLSRQSVPVSDPIIYANALLSRDFPDAYAPMIDSNTMQVTDIDWHWWDYPRWDSYEADAWDAPPSGQWFGRVLGSASDHASLPCTSPPCKKFMMAHPASCFKLMIAVGVMHGIELGVLSLDQDASVNVTKFPERDSPRYVWNGDLSSSLHAMLEVSDNRATTSCIAALHAAGILTPEPGPDRLRTLFDSVGLHLLRFEGTQAGGHWGPELSQRNRSADMDTTGFFHMSSFDSMKLLWLLDGNAPAPQWQVNGVPVSRDSLLSQSSRQYLMKILSQQAFHDALSSTAICGRPTRRPGIPSLEPAVWIKPNGSVIIDDTGDIEMLTPDVFPCEERAQVNMYHKTGLTFTFGSNIAIIRTIPDRISGTNPQRHYIATIFGNIGSRFIDREMLPISKNPCADLHVCYTQNIHDIGRSIDDFVKNVVLHQE